MATATPCEDGQPCADDSTGPRTFTVQAASAGAAAATAATAPCRVGWNRQPPHKLCIYYGIPQAVNGYFDNDLAAQVFATFDYVVFGQGLADPSHQYYASTVAIIGIMRRINPQLRVIGYVDIGVNPPPDPAPTMAQIQLHIDQWKTAGAHDVFFDRAGYDYGCTRQRQNDSLAYARSKAMGGVMNTWNIDDAFSSAAGTGNPTGLAPLLGPQDYYLLESWVVNTDSWTGGTSGGKDGYAGMAATKDKGDKSVTYRKQYGTKMIAVGMVKYADFTEAQTQKYERMQEMLGMVWGLDAWGISDTNYGAGTAKQRPAVYSRDFPACLTSEKYLLNGTWTNIKRLDLGIDVDYDIATSTYNYHYRPAWPEPAP
ncbi:hypothetical protein ACFC1T_08700 [Kitasatospora sp. NPDC056076]|uniref:hypothetical protein n=1 Tax=Kitasatospora sp. NPDC056076 TaxID=3345703 RepID=UPI0035D8CBBF